MPNIVPFPSPAAMLNVYCLETTWFNSFVSIVIFWFAKILSFEPILSYSSARKVNVNVVALLLTSIAPGSSTGQRIGSNLVHAVPMRPPPRFAHPTVNLGYFISRSLDATSLYFMYKSIFQSDTKCSSGFGTHESSIVVPCKYTEGAAKDVPISLMARRNPIVSV